MNDKQQIKKLADIIENNPGCMITIDNDCWWISDKDGNELASTSEYHFKTDSYGSCNEYGQGIMQVFLFMLQKQGFKINMESV